MKKLSTRRLNRPRLNFQMLEDRTVPSTFTVTTNADNGNNLCPISNSLRWAIIGANAAPNVGGPDTIAFNIPGSGVHTIQPLSQLPTITDPVVIDGYTQAGAAENDIPPAGRLPLPGESLVDGGGKIFRVGPDSKMRAYGDSAVLQIELDGTYAGTYDPNFGWWTGGNGLVVTAGNSTVRGLAINRFAVIGILLASQDGNTIEGNFIGTDPTGMLAEGNRSDGIVSGGIGQGPSNGNTIGGLTPAARNVVSGNYSSGIGLDSHNNVIEGNFVGTDATGTIALSTAAGFRSGVFVGGSNNVIGGTTANARNLISGNEGNGIESYGEPTILRNRYVGNYIGTDVTGTTALANIVGVNDHGSGNDIGGSVPGAGNLISGNTNIGVAAAYGTIKGNLIGTDATGTLNVGNGTGVFAGAEIIGGTTPADRNIISGNGYGITGGNGDTIQGNYIGTDSSGMTALANGIGVYIFVGLDNMIGGPTPGARNLISGNTGQNIDIRNGETVVQGNWIGSDATGTHSIGNVGMYLGDNAANNLIGGTSAAEANIFYGNGIELNGPGVTGNRIQGNTINSPMNGIGLQLLGGAHDNTIGGTTPGAGNVIDGGNAGIVLFHDATIGNSILGNVITHTAVIPIAAFSGPFIRVPNDPLDADVGPNNLQNYPVLTSVAGGGSTTIQGTLNSTANTTYRVEFFANATLNPNGYGEGERYLGFAITTTNAGGSATINAPSLAATNPGEYITATATDPNGNTSEFSDAFLTPLTVATATAASVSAPTPLYGVDPVTLSAVVSAVPSGGNPTGSVTFYDETNVIGSAAVVNGVASLPLGSTTLAVGTHAIRAVFHGTGNFTGSEAMVAVTVLAPSVVQGLVYVDVNNDGQVDFGEKAVAGATITLTGIDDLGNAVNRIVQTDANGIYAFINLRPSNAAGYTVNESQPAGYLDGRDTLGTVDGLPTGSAAVNDLFSGIVLHGGSLAENYNFGERPATTGSVGSGQTAAIGFWQNKNGQNLIQALNGGATGTQLGHWLATTFPNMYGTLDGKTNAQVAAFYKTLFARTAQTAPGGPPKVDAQILATAMAVYVTDQTLAGTTAATYGFQVSATGVGARTFNVGGNGAAFGVANNSNVSVLDLLFAVNARSHNGLLYDLNGNGQIDSTETDYRTMANDLFSLINEAGGI